ncbi:SAM-dependent methyltransferase [Halomonas denitrificans]|nr:SAM-dependent methyltransferase [Halomonas denitrificans]
MWTRIVNEIERDGPMPFRRYMEMALYEPGHGYYVNGLHKFGQAGDFTTAPEQGALFGTALAGWLDGLSASLDLDEREDWTLLELGPGSGALARTLLETMERPPRRMLLLEPSAALREVQRETLAALPESLARRVEWIDRPPDAAFDGAIIGNEVIDALPVERIRVEPSGPLREVLEIDARGPRWAGRAIDPTADRESDRRADRQADRQAAARLAEAIARLEADLDAPLGEGYRTEVCVDLPDWLRTVTAPLRRGAVVLADYGYPRREYYHPDRSDGTLVCQYRHRAHFDPLVWPGLTDLSAFVDFTAVADGLIDSGLELAGFTTQAGFLLGSGLLDRLGAVEDERERLRLAGEFKRLALPGEMGEKFKLIAATRDAAAPLAAFELADHRGRL